jgi:predicted helicase
MLEDLLEKLATSASNTTEKGTAFEHLIASYLRTAPEFADRFEDVYLWQEWPGRGSQHDHGIDIVAKELEGGWCAVQCKFYDPQHHVAKGDIDSFLAASSKVGFTSRMIFSTAKDWGPTAEKVLDNLAIPVVRIGLTDLLESKVDWAQVSGVAPVPHILPTTGKKSLRPHQRAAAKAVREGLAASDRGQLVMACGTGKTFTALKIAEELAASRKTDPTTVLFLVPSIQLLNQSLREWKQESELPFRAFAVCSDVQVGKKDPTEDISVHDLIYPATTDTKALAREITKQHEHDRFTVVFSTYQSIDVVAKAQKDGVGTFDLIICDEAHRTTGVTLAGDDESHFVKVHDNSFIAGAKRLYMTATPRLFDPNTKEKAKDASAVLASMDDEAVFGPVLHRLGFGEAVEKNLLTDYRVLVLTVDEQYVAENFQQAVAHSGEIQLGDAAKIIGCWNGLAKKFGTAADDDVPINFTPMRRAVAFAKDIKSSKAAAQAFPEIIERHVQVVAASDVEGDPIGAHLRVEVRHVDGTMNALVRNDMLQWLKEGPPAGTNACRVLSNARCLSEGVDVPALDAVMFLTPRGSQIDVVQSVGRVMRRSEGKDLGYIILPVVIPAGVSPEEALRDNERFKVVWQVLQALRAHDDRFNAMVNKIDLNVKRPDKIQIIDVTGRGGDNGETKAPKAVQMAFDIEGWRDSIYAKIVTKVGERRYWETWAKDVAEIAQQHIVRIKGLLADTASPAATEFAVFLEGLRGNLNDGITQDDAVEMLAQHLITRPVFDALFAGYDFAATNPVAKSMERMLAVLDEHALDTENASLEKFYASVRSRVEGVDNAEGRQRIIVELYDKFFATAFKKTVDKLGIVYTPVEIVDFILNSADQVLRAEFGQGLTDEGVHILDGFTGTGTFMVRLLQSGLIKPEDLARKYANELHANEILLLAYYIAAVNIETTYQDIMRGTLDTDAPYEPFPGLILTDTFQSWEADDRLDLDVFPENNERLERLKALPITVIIGNPPYSVGQESANDDNRNERYPDLDAAIERTYVSRSTAVTSRTIYDSYIRAIKWASLRVGERGVIAFVTNGGFLDANTTDGMRKALIDEFSAIYIFNLLGNQRTAGEQSRREGGKIFGGGSRATVAITLLVRQPGRTEPANLRYAEVGEYLSREQKLSKVADFSSMLRIDMATITPNEYGDWLNQRGPDFQHFLPIGDKSGGRRIFRVHSMGAGTGRDAWVYGSSTEATKLNIAKCSSAYNDSVQASARGDHRVADPRRISWTSSLEARLKRGEVCATTGAEIPRFASYRPFFRQVLQFDRFWIHRPSRLLDAFPSGEIANHGMQLNTGGTNLPFAALSVASIPDLNYFGQGGQFFPRWCFDIGDELDFGSNTDETDTFRRIDNITDEALLLFQDIYGESVTKDEIFFYVYGLLHSQEYREAYAADLKKMLPRIPLVEDSRPFIDAGRKLSELHLSYETATPYPIGGHEVEGPGGEAAYDFFRVEKMRFGKPTSAQKSAGENKDRSTIIYNDRITLTGIPEAAYRYMLGSRSAVEWIIDRYQVKTDKDSGIVNDPNDWSREVGDPRYIIDLLARIVTVSLETMKIVDSLPPLAIRADQGANSKD